LKRKPDDLSQKRKSKARGRVIRRFLLLILAAAAAFFLYTYRYEIASQGVGVLLSDQFALMTKTSAYPVALPEEPSELIAVGRRPAVVSGGTAYVFDPVGEKKVTDRIGGQNTLAVSVGNFLLVYTRGGYDLHLFSGDTELYRLRTDDPIGAACAAGDGSIAVAAASGGTSTVTVCGRSGKETFRWSTSGFVVTALALDEQGRRLAVGGVSSEEGVLTAQVRTFSLSGKGEEQIEEAIADELLLELRWRSDGQLTAVTDRGVWSLDAKTHRHAAFDAQPTAYALFPDGAIAVATGDYLSAHEVHLTRYDASLERTAAGVLAENVARMLPCGNDLLIFTGERVLRCTDTFERTAVYETPGALQVAAGGKTLYYTTVSHLNRLGLD